MSDFDHGHGRWSEWLRGIKAAEISTKPVEGQKIARALRGTVQVADVSPLGGIFGARTRTTLGVAGDFSGSELRCVVPTFIEWLLREPSGAQIVEVLDFADALSVDFDGGNVGSDQVLNQMGTFNAATDPDLITTPHLELVNQAFASNYAKTPPIFVDAGQILRVTNSAVAETVRFGVGWRELPSRAQ